MASAALMPLLGLWPGGGTACTSLAAKECRAVFLHQRLSTSGHQGDPLVVFFAGGNECHRCLADCVFSLRSRQLLLLAVLFFPACTRAQPLPNMQPVSVICAIVSAPQEPLRKAKGNKQAAMGASATGENPNKARPVLRSVPLAPGVKPDSVCHNSSVVALEYPLPRITARSYHLDPDVSYIAPMTPDGSPPPVGTTATGHPP